VVLEQAASCETFLLCTVVVGRIVAMSSDRKAPNAFP
jgi:hypothetical protein